MNLENIRNSLNDYCSKNKLKLFDITYSKSEETLSIILDEKFDMNELEKVSNEISTYLDQYEDEFVDNYILDISTVGVERPIRNEEELKAAIGDYIYVKTKEEEYTGTFIDYKDGIILLEIKDKTRIKDIEVDYSKTKIVRYAVKF